MAGNLKVCIIGAEGWGTAIAAAVSNNVLKGGFDSQVHIYVYDEMIRNTALSEVINSHHENVKYLPGIKLPNNLIAVNDLLEAAQNADILIFSMPHEFVKSYCNILAGNIKETAFAVSMTKGLMRVSGEEIGLVSHTISERLAIPCYSMMSAHSAMEMAQGKLSEVTVGCNEDAHAKLLTQAMQTNNCRIISVNDVDGVELCGTLKDIIALGAGFVDGLRLGENARLTAIHLGIKEMMRFIKTFYPSAKMSTFYESCGVANTVASSFVDKNATFAKSLVTSGKTIEEIEANLLQGRKLLGPMVASDVNGFLEKELLQHEFPLFTAIHLICQSEAPPELMVEALRNHPDLSNSSISHLLSHESEKGEQNKDHVLDQVADTLPKLRSALDKVLARAGNENFKDLKVTEDWTEVNEYDTEETTSRQLASQDSSLEAEEMPSRLSVQATRLHNDIRDGNVQVAFKMDIDEGYRQVQLLLEEDRDSARTLSLMSPRMAAGQEDDNTKTHKVHYMDSSVESDRMAEESINDTTDILDVSSESEPLNLSNQKSEHFDHGEPSPSKLLKMAELKSDIDQQEAVNIKAQENLIKSIRQTIQALGDKEKMEKIIAQSQMEDETLQLKNQVDDADFELKSKIKTDNPQMEEGESSQLISEMEEKNSQLKGEIEDETYQLKGEMSEETSELNNPLEEEINQLKNQPYESEFVGLNPEEAHSLEESQDRQQLKIKSKADNLKELMFADSEEPLEAEKLVEMKLQDENEFELNEEPLIGKKGRTYTKEKMELEEMLEWQKIMQREKNNLQEDIQNYSSEELEDSKAYEDHSRLPIEHDDRLQDLDTHHDEELLQVRAENREISGSDELLNKFGERKPYQYLEEANTRYYSESKDMETGHHEWDWLKNSESIDNDDRTTEPNAKETNETLSKSDQDRLDKLTHQLKEALQHDLDVKSLSQGDENNESMSEEESDPEIAKRITEQPSTPTPAQIPAVPLSVPSPNKQSNIPEGSPQFDNQPRSVPPPSPRTKPFMPKEQQPRRTDAPIKFEDEVRQPDVPASKKNVPADTPKTETIIDPMAKDVSTSKPSKPLKTKKEALPAKQRKQRGGSADAKNADQSEDTKNTEEHRQYIENQKAQLEKMGKKISVMRKGQDRRVNYRGQDPFKGEQDLHSRPPMDTSLEKDKAGESQGLGHQRRKVVVTPPFHPPINPRMRVPRPPFDGRDHEFHTMTTMPVGLIPAVKWPSKPVALKQNPTSLVATIQVQQFGTLRSQVAPQPLLRMPSGMPRTPTFTKILCALQLGLLASYLARCKRD
ncbi:uncharacterized protein LOC108115658 [Drosophila eugracilis]|uniref:uncharacterized protein LOC108115658 n=1 Tax=Drosophila eugracilis TaxID=29029 RepID=UPI001BDB50BE|nr:uncharacterized protein LOC108115658 [Drosophila eugracilis]